MEKLWRGGRVNFQRLCLEVKKKKRKKKSRREDLLQKNKERTGDPHQERVPEIHEPLSVSAFEAVHPVLGIQIQDCL